MTQIRKPAVAGHFYPYTPGELADTVQTLLGREQAHVGPAPKVLIAPHAGYIYSGPVAASAYARLLPFRDRYCRVVLLGPCHQAAITGLAVSHADAFRTPLGDVPLDREVIARLSHPAVKSLEAAHRHEHSLEVHLPFLQQVLGVFKLVPLAVGDVEAGAVAEVIDLLWGGPETLIVVSSDLSHYLPYDQAQQRDRATCSAIEKLDARRIAPEDACGAKPLGGLLIAARRRGVRIETLDLRNSGDTAGGKHQVVGYGSWIGLEE
jgi:AmmeMemoRadiSam system protein B